MGHPSLHLRLLCPSSTRTTTPTPISVCNYGTTPLHASDTCTSSFTYSNAAEIREFPFPAQAHATQHSCPPFHCVFSAGTPKPLWQQCKY
mmetsp:Transcript_57216/g.94791  ORF Transcript_57216/g.94791 Transcript_57216/m.94791 type:complete len:90 (-) Transcript_57216:572-841(-)